MQNSPTLCSTTSQCSARIHQDFTRDAYGKGEEQAHRLIRKTADDLGLTTSTDPAGNLFVELPGEDPSLGAWIVGSHLDSVSHGGNFDGAAGVIAAMAVLAGFIKAGRKPARTVIAAAFRAEESTWFPQSYIGSRASLGILSEAALAKKRRDTGKSLAEHMRSLGFDPDAVAAGQCRLRKEATHAYVELHIEQGPVLEDADIPLGLVTGISGSFRYRNAACHGTYAHSGAVPRRFRQDAVLAVADLATKLDAYWAELEDNGARATVTIGEIATDASQHAFSKVAGEVRFCLDVRADEPALLADLHRKLVSLIAEIEQGRGVRFQLGERTGSEPARMDPGLMRKLTDLACRHGLPALSMPSGAGHDAATFVAAGIPSAMIFIRNQNGSHNPHEAMRMEDFDRAAALLSLLLLDETEERL